MRADWNFVRLDSPSTSRNNTNKRGKRKLRSKVDILWSAGKYGRTKRVSRKRCRHSKDPPVFEVRLSPRRKSPSMKEYMQSLKKPIGLELSDTNGDESGLCEDLTEDFSMEKTIYGRRPEDSRAVKSESYLTGENLAEGSQLNAYRTVINAIRSVESFNHCYLKCNDERDHRQERCNVAGRAASGDGSRPVAGAVAGTGAGSGAGEEDGLRAMTEAVEAAIRRTRAVIEGGAKNTTTATVTANSASWSSHASAQSLSDSEAETLRMANVAAGTVEAVAVMAEAEAAAPRRRDEGQQWSAQPVHQAQQPEPQTQAPAQVQCAVRGRAEAAGEVAGSQRRGARPPSPSPPPQAPCNVNVHIRLVASNATLTAKALLRDEERGVSLEVPTTVDWAPPSPRLPAPAPATATPLPARTPPPPRAITHTGVQWSARARADAQLQTELLSPPPPPAAPTAYLAPRHSRAALLHQPQPQFYYSDEHLIRFQEQNKPPEIPHQARWSDEMLYQPPPNNVVLHPPYFRKSSEHSLQQMYEQRNPHFHLVSSQQDLHVCPSGAIRYPQVSQHPACLAGYRSPPRGQYFPAENYVCLSPPIATESPPNRIHNLHVSHPRRSLDHGVIMSQANLNPYFGRDPEELFSVPNNVNYNRYISIVDCAGGVPLNNTIIGGTPLESFDGLGSHRTPGVHLESFDGLGSHPSQVAGLSLHSMRSCPPGPQPRVSCPAPSTGPSRVWGHTPAPMCMAGVHFRQPDYVEVRAGGVSDRPLSWASSEAEEQRQACLLVGERYKAFPDEDAHLDVLSELRRRNGLSPFSSDDPDWQRSADPLDPRHRSKAEGSGRSSPSPSPSPSPSSPSSAAGGGGGGGGGGSNNPFWQMDSAPCHAASQLHGAFLRQRPRPSNAHARSNPYEATASGDGPLPLDKASSWSPDWLESSGAASPQEEPERLSPRWPPAQQAAGDRTQAPTPPEWLSGALGAASGAGAGAGAGEGGGGGGRQEQSVAQLLLREAAARERTGLRPSSQSPAPQAPALRMLLDDLRARNQEREVARAFDADLLADDAQWEATHAHCHVHAHARRSP